MAERAVSSLLSSAESAFRFSSLCLAMADSDQRPSISFHQSLGGGAVADVLLWRRYCASGIVLGSATILWLLFEKGGYKVVSFVSNVLLLLVTILFIWAKSASLLNRPLPPIPDLEIPVESARKASAVFQVYANHVLSIAHAIAIGRNLTVFVQVMVGLWFVSWMGRLFNFFTLIYLVILLSLSLPLLYEKKQAQIDEKLCVVHKTVQAHFSNISKKIPVAKEKKSL